MMNSDQCATSNPRGFRQQSGTNGNDTGINEQLRSINRRGLEINEDISREDEQELATNKPFKQQRRIRTG